MHIIKKKLKNFYQDTAGSFVILFALTAMVLIGFTGAAIDYARGHLLRSELVSALDAAALATSASVSAADPQAVLQKYFDANFPAGYLGATTQNLQYSLNADNTVLTASVDASLDYTILGIFMGGQMNIAGSTEITLEKRGMEIVLVMDNTGSMYYNSQMSTMKNAALGLIDILYGANETVDDLYVGLVPYVASVNVGNQYTSWTTNHNANDFWPSTWKGCVGARANELSDDTAAVGGGWPVYRWYPSWYYSNAGHNMWLCTSYQCNYAYPYSNSGSSSLIWKNSWGDCPGYRCHINENNSARDWGSGPNKSCASPITPLTQSKSTIQAGINAMESWADGGTLSDVGLAWGWRVISPKWQGLWSGVPADQPFDYDEQLIDKVVVLLTDGRNDVGNSMSAYGVFSSGSAAVAQENQSNTNIGTLCTAMKAEGIIIYTITFNVSGSIQSIYENCATSPAHYFDSPSNSDLDDVFDAIGDSLSNLRISQ